ncbi:gamma-glutamyltransferase family protein (plasmid) [Thioclava sp. 'Guangxiensis']|uniref:gamma-glutamyltransferase family protein n=1 Tax=Thioclava sp. 'Guangxiensis' TaxID=3149044 RepID=UPI0032C41839
MRNLHLAGRSPVMATNAMVASSMPQASLAAIEILKTGGNAVDAAIAANAVLAVVEPQSTGIGGDCFCLYQKAGSTEVIAVNGSGRAPAGASPEALEALGVTALDPLSAHSVTIPGALSAWALLSQSHGRKSLADLLQPAITYAEGGYVVAPRVALDWAEAEPRLQRHDATPFLVAGKAPEAGQVMSNPDLAHVLRRIAAEGVAAFYTGEIAEKLVAGLRARGGVHTLEDFAQGMTAAEFVDPITGRFAGHDIWECPPNGSGVTALLLMGIIDGFAPEADPLAPLRLHRAIEAARLAYRDRNAFVADPRFGDVPVAELLSPAYHAVLRALIRDDARMGRLPEAGTAHKDTVYVSVVDADGNVCSFINSIFQGFGSGIVPEGTGVVLQNRGFGFTLEAGHPNQLAPGKRPMHTIMPSLATRNGRPEIVFGVMGGHFQPMGQAWVIDNMLRYGMDPQAALDLPRLFVQNDRIELEEGISAEADTFLQSLGHMTARIGVPHGGGQAIRIDHDRGILIGGSDPRKDGCALGY